MIRNRIKTIIFFMLILSALPPIKIKAGAGKSFGFFAGGAVAGGLIGSAIAKRNRNDRQQTVVQERIVERPIYVQQQPQQAIATNTQETQNLKYQLDKQQQQIMDLKRELRQERKEAERRTRQQRNTKPTTTKEYSEQIFDDYDPQIEG